MDGKHCSSLRARVLDNILKYTFKRDIGRYEEHSNGSLCGFKRREIVACSSVGGRHFELKDSIYIYRKSGDKLSLNALKNSTGKPSGPGDFPLCIDLMAILISSKVICSSS